MCGAAQSQSWIYRWENGVKTSLCTKEKENTYGIAVDGLSVGQVETLARAGRSHPLELADVDKFEQLVGAAGDTIPDLELHAVGGRTIGHVETLVAEGLYWARKRYNRRAPGDVAVREKVVEVNLIETLDQINRGTIGVGSCDDAVGATSIRRDCGKVSSEWKARH